MEETKPKRGRPRKFAGAAAQPAPEKHKTNASRYAGDRVAFGFKLYEEGHTIDAIAHIMGVSTKTVHAWRATRNWDEQRVARETAPKEIIKNLYAILAKLSRDPDVDPDAIAKLSSAIERLADKKANSYQALQVMDLFSDYLVMANKPDLVRAVAEIAPDFIDHLLKMQL